jgi:hypothetical protein
MPSDPSKVQVVTTADVTWAGGQNFNGSVLFMLALPTFSGNTEGRAYVRGTNLHRVRIPLRQKWPIVDGVLDTGLRLWRNDSIDPSNTRWCAFWYDTFGQLIEDGVSLINITTGDEYTITVPSLTDPTVPIACDTAESLSTVLSTSGGFPTRADLTGSKNGANTAFTVPGGTPSIVLVFWNGQTLDEGIGYTRVGNAISMTTAPDSGDSLEALIWYA